MLSLSWHEVTGAPGARIVVAVQRLTVRPNGWAVSASVRNETHATLTIGRPHHAGGTEFGVLALPSDDPNDVRGAGPGLFATTLDPAAPRALAPNDEWSGTFTGPGRLASGRWIRVELGRFTTVGPAQKGVPWRFSYITDHAVRLG
jgi:hypothetical protein